MKPQQLSLIIASLLVIIAVVYLVFGPVRYDFRYFFNLWNMPEVVRSMVFVEEDDQESRLVEIVRGGLKTTSFPGIKIISLVDSSDVRLALVEQVSSGAVDVVRIEAGVLEPLTDDGRLKTGLTMSPDGTRFAYSVLREGVEQGTVLNQPYDVINYETRVRTLSGEELGTYDGNHPYFWNNETLVFFSDRGIETQNFLTGSHTYVTDSISPYLEARPVFGRNHTMIIRTATSGELTILEFTPEPPLVYRILDPIPGSDTAVALSAERTIYVVTRDNDYSLVQSFTDLEQEPSILLKLPSTFFNPSSVIFAYDN